MNRVDELDYDWDCPREKYIEQKEKEGFTIVYPEPNELQIDIDNSEQKRHFEKVWNLIDIAIPNAYFESSVSQSGRGVHITVTLPFDVSNIERIAFQAALGSDPVRELLSIYRYSRDDEYPTLFVERKENGSPKD